MTILERRSERRGVLERVPRTASTVDMGVPELHLSDGNPVIENMGGGEPSEMEGVLKALRALGALRDPEHGSPTKQGMIFRLRRTKRTSVRGGSLASR